MQHALIIDYKYCTGCHACELSCRNEQELPLEEWGIKLTEHGPVKLGGKWLWNYVPVPSSLCDLCEGRRGRGEKAACEIHCLANCIEIIPLQETGRRIAELGSAVCVFVP
jgi:Fe-S-cluster-containing dehydrogenase component